MSRTYCSQCHYPASTCICSAISTIECPIRIDILQHPSEQKAAKNTARLLKLCIPSCQIWVGESSEDFIELQMSISHSVEDCFVLYPNDASQEATQSTLRRAAAHNPRLIVIDGTWKKAFKIWKLNPWLHELKSLHLNNVEGNYQIRKAPKPHQLSTLESVAHCLTLYSRDINVRPLLHSFEALKKQFQTRT